MARDLVVIGLGYVGLPLAQEATRAGLTVTGLDVSNAVVDGLNAGRSHVDDLSDADMAHMLEQGFTATTDAAVIADASTVVICVPTPLTPEGGPDLGAVLGATRAIASHLRPGHLVVLESTTYPGTTDDEVRPVLEAGGLVAGRDFHLAFSPERIDPGNPTYGMKNTPKVVGGHTEACTDAAQTFYGRFVDTVVRARGTREAEMAKLLENTYRHINIALVNEMARFCDLLDIDIWDAIDAAATKPFGFQRFEPGPGVGGHCIPIDPQYLGHYVQERTGEQFRFVHLAQEINAAMPDYVVSRVERMLQERGRSLNTARVLLLGVTYKADVADDRETPARPIAALLTECGAQVLVHDPLLPEWSPPDLEVTPVAIDAIGDCDVAVLLQAHRTFDLPVIAEAVPVLLDTRGVLPRTSAGVERL